MEVGTQIGDSSSSIELFPKGMWFTTAYAGLAVQPGHHREGMGSGTLGIGYFVWDNFSINAEMTGVGDQSVGWECVGGWRGFAHSESSGARGGVVVFLGFWSWDIGGGSKGAAGRDGF